MTASPRDSRTILDVVTRVAGAKPLRAALAGAALIACTGANAPSVASAASPGALDGTFGKGGVTTLARGTQLNAAAVQRDGKLVVTGLSGGEDRPRLLVARLTRGGSLDRSFGKRGIVRMALPARSTGAIGEDVAIQRDGRIVVAGAARNRTGADGMLVARLNSDGSRDRRFGRRGVAVVLRGAKRQAVANALAIRPNGQIIVGGASSATAALVRLSRRGRVVKRGARLLNIGPATIEAIALLPKGKIAFAGTRKRGQVVVAIIGRAKSNGTRDTTFGVRGVSERSYARGGAAASGFRDIAAQSNGRLIATGYAFDGSGGATPGAFGITARFGSTGRSDDSFGTSGVRYTPSARANTINTQPPPGFAGIVVDRGLIYAGGSWDEVGSSALTVQALTSGGDAEPAFGSGGQVISPIEAYATPGYGNDVALGRQGLYVIGVAGTQGSKNVRGAVARFGARPLAGKANG